LDDANEWIIGGVLPMSVMGLPTSLLQLLREHGASHAPHYPPSDNADHGPMAYLAMHGLGLGFPQIETFADRYRGKLVAQLPCKEGINAHGWETHIGRRASYSALRAYFESEIDAHGWQAVVARVLPSLVSGWVKDAFHPLIRLAYGIEFEVPSEIAGGLAYLAITGDDPLFAAVAKREPLDCDGRSYLEALQSMRDVEFARGPFNSRCRRIEREAAVRPLKGPADIVIKELSRACLEIFHATHDFFALHLVTSSHAFRVCAPWAGPDWSALYSAGVAAGYLAIGAPRFDALEEKEAALPMDALRNATDEHDIKLAYSCLAQARAFSDPTFCWSAEHYLTPRLAAIRWTR
jgi:hypothetical protein